MELSVALISCAAAVFLICAGKILNWVWFKPRSLEKFLRQQGFKGNPYRVFYGDFREIRQMMKEATSKPMEFSNKIAPRVVPNVLTAVQDYGKNCFQWFGPKPTVFVWNPDHVREILSKNFVFQRPYIRPDQRLVGGLAFLEKDQWAKHRRLINPAFHVEKLKHMVPSFYQSCADMLSKWDKLVPGEGSCELDVWPHLQAMTSDVISRTAFGSSYEEGRKVFELLKDQQKLLMKVRHSVYIPGWRFLPTEHNRRMKEIVKEIESSIMGIIDKRMKAIKTGESSGNDLLGLLLESNINEIKQSGDESGMSFQEVIEECKLFYFAGQETTSSLLAWTMILLSKHPNWQARAREEVMQVFGCRKPEYQELNQLKVVSMIFHEVMRLYPPIAVIPRMAQQESTFGELTFPAGVQLWLPIIMLHHDTEIWGDNALEFDPERFSEGVSKATKGRLTYLPFAWGPRICIGQNFAMTEAKIAMALILQHYSFELSPSYAHAPYAMITLQPQHGAHLIMQKN